MAHYTPTYPVLVYLVVVITSATRNTIVSGEAQQFDATILEGGCPVTDDEFMQTREDIRQQLIPIIEGDNVQPPTAQPTTEEVKPPPTTAPPPTTQPTTEVVTPSPTTKPTESPVTSPPIIYTCNGTPGWRRVAFINMTDTNYDCPPGLNLTSHPTRTCGRANTDEGCSSTTFSVGGSQYSRVCGRIRGYQFGDASAFYGFLMENQATINGFYVDGVSLTHGAAGSRQHIWTFAAGLTESETAYPNHVCPCDTSGSTIQPPAFVGTDYFCESGLNSRYLGDRILYPNDPLWDGQNCLSSSTCCRFNNPPWFTKTLPSSTTNDIELRVCLSGVIEQDDTPIQLIELYIQ